MNNTRKKKHYVPSLKILPLHYSLYASKKYKGEDILEYQRIQEKKKNDPCVLDNSSWFGDYEVAKSYKTKETKLYRWKTKNMTKLLNINKHNKLYFQTKFKQCKEKLIPAVHLTHAQIKTIEYEHPYIKMSQNDKAYYEFCFVFGYLSIKQQVEFMKLIIFLIKHKYISMVTREGNSVAYKMNLKVKYYLLNNYFAKKHSMNRLSFYYLDKHSMMNLCKCIPKNIAGVYQKNTNSFWFPDFVIYKMNIQEYILFNPHHNLIYDKEMD